MGFVSPAVVDSATLDGRVAELKPVVRWAMFGMLNIVDPSHQPSDTCGLLSLSLHALG